MQSFNIPVNTIVGYFPTDWGTSDYMILLPAFSGDGSWLQINAHTNSIIQVGGTDSRGVWTFIM